MTITLTNHVVSQGQCGFADKVIDVGVQV